METLDRLSAKFAGQIRKRRVIEALGRFSYASMLLGRFPLAAAAEDARAFVEGSDSAGKALVAITAELRKEVRPPERKTTKERGQEPPDIRIRVANAMKAADPTYVRLGPPLVRELTRRLRHADFRGRADSSALTSLSVKFRGDDPGAAVAVLMGLEGQGLVAIGSDPYRKKGAMIVVSGAEAIREVRSSKVISFKRRRHVRRIRRRLSAAEMRAVGLSSRAGVRYPIAFKLILITVSLTAMALSLMIFLTSYFLREDARQRMVEMNDRSAQELGLEVTDDFRAIVEKAHFLLSLRDADEHVDKFFAANPEILYAGVEGKFEFFNVLKIADWGAYREVTKRIRSAEARLLEAGKEAPAVGNITPHLGRPAVLIVVPYREGEVSYPFAIAVDTSGRIDSLRLGGGRYTFVVDGEGKLVLHSDSSELASGNALGTLPIVDLLLHSGADKGQTLYRDATGTEYLGSFLKTDFADLGVVSVTPTAFAFAAVDRIQLRSLYLMVAMLVVVMLFVYVYSASITGRIGLLMEAALRVKNGVFRLDMEPPARDELGALAARIAEMAAGLGEREKIKEAFGKPIDGELAQRALRNGLSLGGERRVATVLFSEVRGFQVLSESLEPKESIEFLNAYFTAVVGCVDKAGGLVDKLLGDAVMAVWGLPFSSERDSAAAVDAALLMRATLESLNKSRGTKGKPRIAMGCAIDTGQVIAGRIGSERHMEYTATGATVKLITRLEALTKRFEVDILVSEAVRVELGAIYRLATMPRVRVTEKNRAQHVYVVLGRMDDVKAPRSIAELRARLGSEDRAVYPKAVPKREGKK